MKKKKLFKQACWLHCKDAIGRYLISQAYRRRNDSENSLHHEELCCFYIAVVKGEDNADLVRRRYEAEYQAVYTKTQELTDHLEEVIGFTLDSQPDYDTLIRKFFAKFHSLALEALGVKS